MNIRSSFEVPQKFGTHLILPTVVLNALRQYFFSWRRLGNWEITDAEVFYRAYILYRKYADDHPYMRIRLEADLEYYQERGRLPTFVARVYFDLFAAAH